MIDLGTDRLRFDVRGSLAWCTVDNPARRNALSPAMYRGLGRAVHVATHDPAIRALIVTGVDDVFVVGGDLADHDDDEPFRDEELPFQAMHRGDIPVVAAINGHCQASGVELAVLADVAVASDRARFRLPELRRGVGAPWSAALLPASIGLVRAKELALTSRPVDAAEALAIGLVARVVPHDDLFAAAERAAGEVLAAGPEARRAWIRRAHGQVRLPLEVEVAASVATSEAAEGFAAFVQRRSPAWSPAP